MKACHAPEPSGFMCGRPVVTAKGGAQGLCQRCYQRARRHGTLPKHRAVVGAGPWVHFRVAGAQHDALAALSEQLGVRVTDLARLGLKLVLTMPETELRERLRLTSKT